jgi:hypothetical protein
VLTCSYFKKYIKKCLEISIKYGWIDDAKMHAHAKSKIQKKSCVREKEKCILLLGVRCGSTSSLI